MFPIKDLFTWYYFITKYGIIYYKVAQNVVKNGIYQRKSF